MTVSDVAFHSAAEDLSALPWRSQWIGEGAIGVHVDRTLLTLLLEMRYGASVQARPINAPEALVTLETATEQRLAKRLATDFAFVFARAIPTEPLQPAVTAAPPAAQFQPELFVTFDVADTERRVGRIAFALEETWQHRLFAHLCAMNRRAKMVKREEASLASRLKIKLTAQLLEMELPFGDVLRLRVGSVLPIRWHSSALVLTNGNPLFSATVAESDGKICLIDLTDLG